MGSVHQDPRLLANHLHPSGQRYGAQTGDGLLVVDLKAPALEGVQHAQGHPTVDSLVLTQKRDVQMLEPAVGRGQAQPGVRADRPRRLETVAEVVVLPGQPQRSVHRSRGGLEHLLDLRDLRGADHRNARLDDAGLLRRYRPQRFPQLGGMVVAYAGDAADLRLDDVGGVQAPAEPGLDHRQIRLLVGEVGEGDGGHRLEVGRLPPGARSLNHPPGQTGKPDFRDHPPVDRDSLPQGHQVRRRIQTHLVPHVPEHVG